MNHLACKNDGTIQIPYSPFLFDKEVEVIIVPKLPKKENATKAGEFVKKWAGFLNNTDIDNSKFDYLTEKYK